MYDDKTVADLRADGFAVLVYNPSQANMAKRILQGYQPQWIEVESIEDLEEWMAGTVEAELDRLEAQVKPEFLMAEGDSETHSQDDFKSMIDRQASYSRVSLKPEYQGQMSDIRCKTTGLPISEQMAEEQYGVCPLFFMGLSEDEEAEVFADWIQWMEDHYYDWLDHLRGVMAAQYHEDDEWYWNAPRFENEIHSAETHSHAPHDYYTPVGPSDTPDVSGYLSQDGRMDIDSFMAESVGFAAEYDGPSTLSSALSGARKTDKNGRHLTIIQRLVAKYGIEKGTRIYKHFGVKQKRASPKVRGKVRGTKSGPRRYSEGRVGGAGRSQVYQKGDRTGSWTKSGGYTTSYANSGKAWYQERGYGTPVMGPVPDTALAGKAMGEKARGHYVNPAGIVGYPFVPAQQREQKRK